MLIKNKKHLRLTFEEAICPSINEFSGKYQVEMLTGPFVLLNLFQDKKIFENGTGHNLIGKIKWGHFFLTEDGEKILINYNVKKNIFTKGIGDFIKWLGDDFYLGQFTWTIIGHRFSWGYFSLKKCTN